MQSLADKLDKNSLENKLILPDIWQQEALSSLREGKDVVLHAPTGAGKTMVFELWSNNGRPKQKAIYTVPTRALANDKMAEWKSKGWDVGIATGDLSTNLDAPILVATLETQKNRLLTGFGPSLLVIDEYQMIGDRDRGLNYELSLALCPPRTQLLLMSGSVANPDDIVSWLRRLGRSAVLVRHDIRPVPLEESNPIHYSNNLPSSIQGPWPKLISGALAEDLGPILVFAPQRKNAERLARELAQQVPNPHPLALSPEQKALLGDHLSGLVEKRIAYHHSGLSYGARAGVIEPLAKNGQLKVIVATMGLAAGINFSMRSVVLAGNSYKRDYADHLLEPAELLQMYGRAGRRGIDETGYLIVSSNRFKLCDGYPGYLKRSGIIDWAALIGIMHTAVKSGKKPFHEAIRVQSRLFTTKPIPLGIEFCVQNPGTPCGLNTDAERARLSQNPQVEMLNSKGFWEPLVKEELHPAHNVRFHRKLSKQSMVYFKSLQDGSERLFHSDERNKVSNPENYSQGKNDIEWLEALTSPHIIHKASKGPWVELKTPKGKIITRKTKIADQLHSGNFVMVKQIRRMSRAPRREVTPDVWYQSIIPEIKTKFLESEKTPVMDIIQEGYKVYALLSLENTPIKARMDSHGVPIWNPLMRDIMDEKCVGCNQISHCQKLDKSPGVAFLWKKLGLIDSEGEPTIAGQIVSFFPQGSGLAIAAAILNETYNLNELIYDIANLDAGFRFSNDDGDRWGGRLARSCKQAYNNTTVQGYLINGVPPNYGYGASQIVYSLHQEETTRNSWVTPNLGIGDIDRMIIEWRSLLRQITNAPDLPNNRWKTFQELAFSFFKESESPTQTDLPELEFLQTQRVSHKLEFR